MKFLPRVCDPSLFSRLPGTQFPVSMIHSETEKKIYISITKKSDMSITVIYHGMSLNVLYYSTSW